MDFKKITNFTALLFFVTTIPNCSKEQPHANAISVAEKKQNPIIFLEKAPSEEEWGAKKIVMKQDGKPLGFIN